MGLMSLELGEGETSFPTIVLSAEELRLACQVHGGEGSGPEEESGGSDGGGSSETLA